MAKIENAKEQKTLILHFQQWMDHPDGRFNKDVLDLEIYFGEKMAPTHGNSTQSSQSTQRGSPG